MSWILDNLAQVVTGLSTDPAKGVLQGVAVAVTGDEVVAIAPARELAQRLPDAQRVDGGGGVLTPGFVDSHSHAIFGGYRFEEFALRCQGVPYMEIARRGGGILSSVRDVRARSEDELVELARPRVAECLPLGTTTIEVKSGYGLTLADELKMLRAIRRLDAEQPVTLIPTFLGAHEVPAEYRDRRDAYVSLVIEEMVPAVAAGKLARFCDVFLEPGVFTRDEARRILDAGAAHGLVPKLHADELQNSGGAELAVEVGAASADHLGAISDAGIAALAGSSTVATLLPSTLLFLGRKTYAPARRLIDAGATIALATDFNPGSSPTPSMPLVLTLACTQMGIGPLEALVAATRGGAQALRLEDGTGTIARGAPADLVLWNVSDYREIPYHAGLNRVARVWKGGVPVVPSSLEQRGHVVRK